MPELKRIYWTRQSLRLAMAVLTLWISAAAILSFMGNASKFAVGRSTSVTDVFTQTFDGVLPAVLLPGALVAVLIVSALVMQARDVRRRDPVRRFTRQQRREGMARADGQCEMEAGFRRRCSRPAEHGDHFYPWSKGGSTSLQNFVAACSRCNRAKGARIPSPAQQARLERRRLAYVEFEDAVRVGERRELS
ncbi:HNH endonuclease [Arthrobacter sp. D1-17]